MNYLIAKIFVKVESQEDILKYIDVQYENIDILKNPERDDVKGKIFPDGFLFFPYIVEIYSNQSVDDGYISKIKKILLGFWHSGYPAVIACDFEEKLPEKGGYKSKNTPWV